MKTCKRCNVRVSDDSGICPLCHTVLTEHDGVRTERTYPDLFGRTKTYNLLTRILLFLSIVGGIAAIVVNYLTYDKVMWSLLTTAVILYYWSAIIHSIRHQVNVASKILVQAVCASVLSVLADYVLGFSNWSINYVVPSILTLAGIAVLIIILVNRVHFQTYIIYQFIIGVLGFVPFLLFVFGVVNKPFMSIVATIVSALSLIGTSIFGEKTVRSELKRRFHL